MILLSGELKSQQTSEVTNRGQCLFILTHSTVLTSIQNAPKKDD